MNIVSGSGILEGIEAAMDVRCISFYHQSRSSFIQRAGFCFELFSAHVSTVQSILCESIPCPLAAMETQCSMSPRRDAQMSKEACGPE